MPKKNRNEDEDEDKDEMSDFFKGFGDPSKKQYSRRVILGIHGGLPDK